MLIFILWRCIVTLNPQVLIFNMILVDDISNDMVDKHTKLICVIAQMEVVSVIDRICNATMKSKLLPWKVCWLDFILRTLGKILREVQLDIFTIVSELHFRKNSWNIIYACSVFEIGITGLQQFLSYVLDRFVVINASYSFVFAGCPILLCIWLYNTFTE